MAIREAGTLPSLLAVILVISFVAFICAGVR